TSVQPAYTTADNEASTPTTTQMTATSSVVATTEDSSPTSVSISALVNPTYYEFVYSGTVANLANATLMGCSETSELSPSGSYNLQSPGIYSLTFSDASLISNTNLLLEVRDLPELQLVSANSNLTNMTLTFSSFIRSESPYLGEVESGYPINWNITQGSWNASDLFDIQILDAQGSVVPDTVSVVSMTAKNLTSEYFVDSWNIILSYTSGSISQNETLQVTPVVENCLDLLYPHGIMNSAEHNDSPFVL
ncbi:hypothetical protein HDU84_006992, partial [Entophlyctis sp. JEL0112]